jgi:TIR domain/FHA domain
MLDAAAISGGSVSGIDIFLSYARQDRATARIFAECLADDGFSVWWDASLHSGETFDEVIERNLREAGAVVVLWSPRSVASRWVRAEATLADRRNKLAPAIIDPCDRPIIFELTHAAELSDWTGDIADTRWQNFVSDLRRLVEATREQAHVASPPAAVRKTEDVSHRAQPPSRQPLRPGNAEVIVADRPRRDPQLPASRVREEVADVLPIQREVHCLEIEEGDVAQSLVVVDSSGMKIGRAAPADIVLSHKSISREHCIIGLANDELLVTDLNSTNGSYIDSVRVSRTSILPVGSVLRLGQISLKHAILTEAEAERLGGLSPSGHKGDLQAGHFAAAS